MMDNALFWTIFGAVGTTIGSFATAIAVIIAIRQYRQPLIKKLIIKVRSAIIPKDISKGDIMLSIDVANSGIRPIVITNIYLNAGKGNLVINNLQPDYIPTVSFPEKLDIENSLTLFISMTKLSHSIKELIDNGQLTDKKNKSVRAMVTDATGGEYYSKVISTIDKMANFKIIKEDIQNDK